MGEIIDLRKVASGFKDKLSKIKIFLADVDGVMTNGIIYYSGEEVGYNRFFHAHDGYGFKMLREAGIKIGIISGGNSVGLIKRAEYLECDYIKVGNEDKRGALDEILVESGCTEEEVVYIGDEFFDLPILKRVGFSATVPEASVEIKEAVDYITTRKGGEGAVREVIDMLRFVQNIVPRVPGL